MARESERRRQIRLKKYAAKTLARRDSKIAQVIKYVKSAPCAAARIAKAACTAHKSHRRTLYNAGGQRRAYNRSS